MRNLLHFSIFLAVVSFCGSIPAQEQSEKVERRDYQIEGTPRKIWVYFPKGDLPEKLPCILIGAAGSRLFHGVNLTEGDSAEHYPYVAAGFAVVAYDISGPLKDEELQDEGKILKAATAFTKSQGGIDDAQTALAYAVSKHSFIDLKRVYAVGHSSAATTALTLAQNSRNIRGCVAYAPIVDLEGRFGKKTIAAFEKGKVKLGVYVSSYSPMANIQSLKCPLFLFNAKDDSAVSTADIHAYATKLKAAGKECVYNEVDEGEHYQSMIDKGIPSGIQWLKKLDKAAMNTSAGPN